MEIERHKKSILLYSPDFTSLETEIQQNENLLESISTFTALEPEDLPENRINFEGFYENLMTKDNNMVSLCLLSEDEILDIDNIENLEIIGTDTYSNEKFKFFGDGETKYNMVYSYEPVTTTYQIDEDSEPVTDTVVPPYKFVSHYNHLSI